MMSYNDEPPLHRAVLMDDFAAIKLLSAYPEELHKQNQLGFNAKEIARYLGKKTALEIMQPCSRKSIRVWRRGTSYPKMMDETEFRNFFFIDYLPYQRFSNYEAFRQVIKNCPWTLSYSFWGRENRELAVRYRSELDQAAIAETTIQWVNDELGYGLFAASDLPANSYIGEFTGNVRALYRTHPDANAYCFHYPTRLWSWQYTVIDAQKKGNETRFINHSDQPNLEPLCVCDRNLLHIIFVCKTDIKSGSQLTYNYGADFWRRRRKIAF